MLGPQKDVAFVAGEQRRGRVDGDLMQAQGVLGVKEAVTVRAGDSRSSGRPAVNILWEGGGRQRRHAVQQPGRTSRTGGCKVGSR